MCREAFKRYDGCEAVLTELFICTNFIAFTFMHPDALVVDCPNYQILNTNYPSGRCNCADKVSKCEFRERNGERIVTFEERGRDYTDQAKRYNEWLHEVGTGARFREEVERLNAHSICPTAQQLAIRRRLAAILEVEMVIPPPLPEEVEKEIKVESEGGIQMEEIPDYEPLPKRIKRNEAPQVQPTKSAAITPEQTSQQVEATQVQETQSKEKEEIEVFFKAFQYQPKPQECQQECQLYDAETILALCGEKWKPAPHIQSKDRYIYLGERRTPEEWKIVADRERDRIFGSMTESLKLYDTKDKNYVKQERKLDQERGRWYTMYKEAETWVSDQTETRSFFELILYINECSIQRGRMEGEWGYIVGRLTDHSMKNSPVPDVLEKCRSFPLYNYTPGQNKSPQEWLEIAEQEKKRCIRALGSLKASGKHKGSLCKPTIQNDETKRELARWDQMYKHAAQLRDHEPRSIHEIVLDINCSTLRHWPNIGGMETKD